MVARLFVCQPRWDPSSPRARAQGTYIYMYRLCTCVTPYQTLPPCTSMQEEYVADTRLIHTGEYCSIPSHPCPCRCVHPEPVYAGMRVDHHQLSLYSILSCFESNRFSIPANIANYPRRNCIRDYKEPCTFRILSIHLLVQFFPPSFHPSRYRTPSASGALTQPVPARVCVRTHAPAASERGQNRRRNSQARRRDSVSEGVLFVPSAYVVCR